MWWQLVLDIGSYLSDAWKTNDERDEANSSDEELFASTEQMRPFVDNGGDETLESTELFI